MTRAYLPALQSRSLHRALPSPSFALLLIQRPSAQPLLVVKTSHSSRSQSGSCQFTPNAVEVYCSPTRTSMNTTRRPTTVSSSGTTIHSVHRQQRKVAMYLHAAARHPGRRHLRHGCAWKAVHACAALQHAHATSGPGRCGLCLHSRIASTGVRNLGRASVLGRGAAAARGSQAGRGHERRSGGGGRTRGT